MKVYKSSVWTQAKNLFWYVIGAIFLCFLVQRFTDNALIYFGIPLLVVAYPVYSTLFSDNIRLELTDDKHLIIRRRGKVEHDFRTDEIEVSFKFVTGSNDEFSLYVTDQNTAKKYTYDCELLGEKQFRALLTDLGAYRPDEPVKVAQVDK